MSALTKIELNLQNNWLKDLQESNTSGNELLSTLGLKDTADDYEDAFRAKVPKEFIQQIELRNPDDPLLLQILPTAQEHQLHPDESSDPVGDLDAEQGDGIIHKYTGRVLLIATGACAIHCRYCFRKDFPYNKLLAARNNWSAAIKYIQQHPKIHEVILSGGDPLTLKTDKLKQLTRQLEQISHVKTLRIHSRIPTVLPNRINEDLCQWLAQTKLITVIVIHCNHANEISENVQTALAKLNETGVQLLNQSVLLRGVNNNAEALIDLSMTLHANKVLPYYLHQLDSARGTHHFTVSDKDAVLIIKKLRSNLPGYLVPQLVREISGEANKTPISSNIISS